MLLVTISKKKNKKRKTKTKIKYRCIRGKYLYAPGVYSKPSNITLMLKIKMKMHIN